MKVTNVLCMTWVLKCGDKAGADALQVNLVVSYGSLPQVVLVDWSPCECRKCKLHILVVRLNSEITSQ